MWVEDLQPKGSGWLIRLNEKGGKQHSMPCHHSLAEHLHAYIAAAGIAEDKKGWLFRTSSGHHGVMLSDAPMVQTDAWRVVRKRALAAGIMAPIGNHTLGNNILDSVVGRGYGSPHEHRTANPSRSHPLLRGP